MAHPERVEQPCHARGCSTVGLWPDYAPLCASCRRVYASQGSFLEGTTDIHQYAAFARDYDVVYTAFSALNEGRATEQSVRDWLRLAAAVAPAKYQQQGKGYAINLAKNPNTRNFDCQSYVFIAHAEQRATTDQMTHFLTTLYHWNHTPVGTYTTN